MEIAISARRFSSFRARFDVWHIGNDAALVEKTQRSTYQFKRASTQFKHVKCGQQFNKRNNALR